MTVNNSPYAVTAPEAVTPATAVTPPEPATPTSKMTNLVNRLRHDRGAVLVEAAICIPLLLLVIMGAAEAGFAWESKSATVSGVRSGVLRASTSANAPGTDLQVLRSIVGEIGGDNAARIQSVAIFEASVDPEQKFQDCINGGQGQCVIYDTADIAGVVDGTLTLSEFDNGRNGDADGLTYSCDATKKDAGFCAGSRTVPFDSTLAVAITYQHSWFTGILPFNPPVFQEYVVSSTFTDGGSDVTASGPPAALAFAETLATFSGGPYNGVNPDVNFTATRRGGINPLGIREATSPSGEQFLGPNAIGESVTINIVNQTPGATVCVEFDLLVIASWDSAQGDRFDATITGATSETDGSVYGVNNVPGTNAPDDRLGYTDGWNQHDSTVGYGPLCAEVRPNGTVDIAFTSGTSDRFQSLSDESWGVDNINIEVTEP